MRNTAKVKNNINSNSIRIADNFLDEDKDYSVNYLPSGQIIRKLSKTDLPTLAAAINDDDSFYPRQKIQNTQNKPQEKWNLVEYNLESKVLSFKKNNGKTVFYDYEFVSFSDARPV